MCTITCCWLHVNGMDGLFLRFSITLFPTQNSPDQQYNPMREMCGFHWPIWVVSFEGSIFLNQFKFVRWIFLWTSCKAEWWALIIMCYLDAVLDIKCGWLIELQWKWNTVNTTDLFTAFWELVLPPEASCHLKIHWKYIWHNSSLRYLQAYAIALPLELLGHARNCVCYGAYWFHSRDITTMTPCDK